MKEKITIKNVLAKNSIFAATLVLCMLLWINREAVGKLSGYGYAGIFLVSFVSSATVLFPVPGLAGVFFGGAVWNPLSIGVLSALGSTLGELFGYYIGDRGKELISEKMMRNRMVVSIKRVFQKAGFITILVFSALPFPFFDVIGILSGSVSYPVWKFACATFLGRLIKGIALALAGSRVLPS